MIEEVLKSIRELTVSQTVRGSLWIFPALECIHIYSMILLITVVGTFDMRLMGFKLVREAMPLSKLAKMVFVLVSICFGVNFLTGLLLFGSRATEYYVNSAFQLKLLLIALAIAYHWVLFRKAAKWDDTPGHIQAARVAGLTSLVLWVGVIAASRWIAFV